MSEQLSPETIRTLQSLRSGQNEYAQRADQRIELADKSVLAFVGAGGEGKNTVMDALAKTDNNYKIIGTVTSREPRESDTGVPYVYYEHTDMGLQPLLAAIGSHSLVQYFVMPYEPYYVYGSTLEDYPAAYNIGDYFAESITDLRTRGFRQVLAVSVISPPEEWLPRFEERFPPGDTKRASRRDEAIKSFQWSLSQTKEHLWVVNRSGKVQQAVNSIIAAMQGNREDHITARNFAELSLAAAEKLAI